MLVTVASVVRDLQDDPTRWPAAVRPHLTFAGSRAAARRLYGSPMQDAYRELESATLSALGRVLRKAPLAEQDVRIPRSLADRAVAAWERDDVADRDPGETTEQRLHRHRAGTLALIGLAIYERGREDGEDVIVALHPESTGVALNASDDDPASGKSASR